MEHQGYGDCKWYAIQVRSRSEFSTAMILQGQGFEPFVPKYTSRRRWSDRNVDLVLPLFPGYIFCRFNANVRMPIIATAGVVRIVGTRKMPLPIEAHEIEAVRRILQAGYKAEPHAYITVGSRVRIGSGTLAGLEGIVEGQKNRHLILSIALIQQSISVELDGVQLVGEGSLLKTGGSKSDVCV